MLQSRSNPSTPVRVKLLVAMVHNLERHEAGEIIEMTYRDFRHIANTDGRVELAPEKKAGK